MPAAAVKTAPQPKKPNKAPQNAENAYVAGKSGPSARLYDLPQSAGVALMALLLVIALFVGNARALQKANPGSILRQGSVVSIVEDRAAQAQNAVNVAQRALTNPSSRVQSALAEVDDAMSAFLAASDAQQLSRADQTLTSAVSELTAAVSGSLSGEDQRMYQRALDNFAEQGSFLRQEARAYNEKAQKALGLYKALPTRFMLKQPSVYEGI